MLKKHMTPLSKGGQKVSHRGKGSQVAGMPDRRQIASLSNPGNTINNYAKASPMPQGVGTDDDTSAPLSMPPMGVPGGGM